MIIRLDGEWDIHHDGQQGRPFGPGGTLLGLCVCQDWEHAESKSSLASSQKLLLQPGIRMEGDMKEFHDCLGEPP